MNRVNGVIFKRQFLRIHDSTSLFIMNTHTHIHTIATIIVHLKILNGMLLRLINECALRIETLMCIEKRMKGITKKKSRYNFKQYKIKFEPIHGHLFR